MFQSKLFSRTSREAAKEEKSANAVFLERAGFIDKLSSGIYSFLPLGFMVLKKIEGIIRQEMQGIGGQELLLPALHPKLFWQKTKRWDSMDDLYKLKEGEKEFALGPTHEEIIVPLAKKFIKAENDLPLYLYQIQTKFRKEKRAKSGILRVKEFIMKDLYSFHSSQEDLDRYYEKVKRSYFKIFQKVGIKKQFLYLTYASGGSFSKYSHEFQALTPAGEDTIYICKKCGIAVNKEIKSKTPSCPNCGSKNFEVKKAVEIGNIFKLKTKFSEPFGLTFTNKQGEKKFVLMGCYGIGLGRLLGAVVELNNDSKGIIWPDSIAPFNAHILPLQSSNKAAAKSIENYSKKLYSDLTKAGISVLYDDRKNKAAGEKFVDADLIGIPWRLVVSEKTLEKQMVELKERSSGRIKLLKKREALNFLKKKYVK